MNMEVIKIHSWEKSKECDNFFIQSDSLKVNVIVNICKPIAFISHKHTKDVIMSVESI